MTIFTPTITTLIPNIRLETICGELHDSVHHSVGGSHGSLSNRNHLPGHVCLTMHVSCHVATAGFNIHNVLFHYNVNLGSGTQHTRLWGELVVLAAHHCGSTARGAVPDLVCYHSIGRLWQQTTVRTQHTRLYFRQPTKLYLHNSIAAFPLHAMLCFHSTIPHFHNTQDCVVTATKLYYHQHTSLYLHSTLCGGSNRSIQSTGMCFQHNTKLHLYSTQYRNCRTHQAVFVQRIRWNLYGTQCCICTAHKANTRVGMPTNLTSHCLGVICGSNSAMVCHFRFTLNRNCCSAE